ncbi:HAD domain-containing protein [Acidovorax sp.]|uniref:HAD domain-containing protein n=1 Tax=Acidovorax sp. TaxID=1872122 RepID=UPI00344ED60B
MKLVTLFLDFDGVTHPLHCHERKHFSCLAGIEAVLRECPTVEVVLSTTWRLRYELDHLRRPFSDDIRPRVVGSTPLASSPPSGPSRLDAFSRHKEVWHWMLKNRNASDRWLAIDDRPYLFRPFSDAVIECDPRTGADEQVLARLKVRLLQMGQTGI